MSREPPESWLAGGEGGEYDEPPPLDDEDDDDEPLLSPLLPLPEDELLAESRLEDDEPELLLPLLFEDEFPVEEPFWFSLRAW